MAEPLSATEYRLLVEHSPVMIWRAALDAGCECSARRVAHHLPAIQIGAEKIGRSQGLGLELPRRAAAA